NNIDLNENNEASLIWKREFKSRVLTQLLHVLDEIVSSIQYDDENAIKMKIKTLSNSHSMHNLDYMSLKQSILDAIKVEINANIIQEQILNKFFTFVFDQINNDIKSDSA
ncbi:unnamed protein product, partial [Didymodactylos carnosus]